MIRLDKNHWIAPSKWQSKWSILFSSRVSPQDSALLQSFNLSSNEVQPSIGMSFLSRIKIWVSQYHPAASSTWQDEWGCEILMDGHYEEQTSPRQCHLDEAAVLKIVWSIIRWGKISFLQSTVFHWNEISSVSHCVSTIALCEYGDKVQG